MGKRGYLLILLMASTVLAGCQNMSNREAAATVVGTVAGAVVGAQFGHHGGQVAAAAVGALLGGAVGNAIGRSADESDLREASNGFARASRVSVGETVYWHNERTGHYGSFKPVRDGHSRYGNYCREFVTNVYINGQIQRSYGTTCRQPNGTWYLI